MPSLVTAGSVLLGTARPVPCCSAPARPANRELDHECAGFGGHIKDGDLAAARAALTSTAAGVTSLRELRGYARRLDAANEPAEAAVRVIRGQLGLPPPDTS